MWVIVNVCEESSNNDTDVGGNVLFQPTFSTVFQSIPTYLMKIVEVCHYFRFWAVAVAQQ